MSSFGQAEESETSLWWSPIMRLPGVSLLCGQEERRTRGGGSCTACSALWCNTPSGRGKPGACYEFSAEGQAPISYLGEAQQGRGIRVYSSAPHQPLLGVPLREGSLWHLSTQDCFEPVTFSLYVNGIAFATTDGMEASISLSPFSLVRNCRFQAGECSKLKSFKVSLLEQDICCYFAVQSVCERAAEEERSSWVLGISHTILLITNSLLPRVPITCDPVPRAAHTNRRLLAGYLIHRDDENSLSVVYCELGSHGEGAARLAVYEDHHCSSWVMDVPITETAVCCDVVGINCSCFVVDCHNFASQTPSERKLWLRALSNVKVKLQNRAPVPCTEDLAHYRRSIRETIRANEVDFHISGDALLAPCVRPPGAAAEAEANGVNGALRSHPPTPLSQTPVKARHEAPRLLAQATGSTPVVGPPSHDGDSNACFDQAGQVADDTSLREDTGLVSHGAASAKSDRSCNGGDGASAASMPSVVSAVGKSQVSL
eukprot:TRINITY_DN3627_c1_g1_i1.p1 TRINITY_DN3627_c1_g1~~TRINITY_DN3627_c1_g1_i1.p1  ORF type:complete len:487 (-),score=65.18 TRINITY_DN3627_c1_g1_i1:100-1560(-)